MGIFERFEKKEKLHIDPDTGKSEWIVKQKGLPTIRKEKTVFDQRVKDFQKAEHERKKAATKAKLEKYGKKWAGVQKWVGKNINPDVLSMGYTPTVSSSHKPKQHHHKNNNKKYVIRNGVAFPVAGSGKKHRKKHRRSDDNWFDPLGGNLF